MSCRARRASAQRCIKARQIAASRVEGPCHEPDGWLIGWPEPEQLDVMAFS
jgi:hypothetical protein